MGITILLGMSWAAFLRSRRVGRNPIIWIPLVWASAYATGYLFRVATAETLLAMWDSLGLDMARGKFIVTSFTIAGMTIGGLMATLASGWPLRVKCGAERDGKVSGRVPRRCQQ